MYGRVQAGLVLRHKQSEASLPAIDGWCMTWCVRSESGVAASAARDAENPARPLLERETPTAD